MEQKTSVVLTCGDRFEGTEIRWRKNQHDIPAKGNSIEVSIEAMLGGNFTCHGASGDVLNHTLVLVSPLDFDKAVLLPSGDKGNGKRTKKKRHAREQFTKSNVESLTVFISKELRKRSLAKTC